MTNHRRIKFCHYENLLRKLYFWNFIFQPLVLGNLFFRTPNQFCRCHLRTEQDIRKRTSEFNSQYKTLKPNFFFTGCPVIPEIDR
jgi:hypothetical protein